MNIDSSTYMIPLAITGLWYTVREIYTSLFRGYVMECKDISDPHEYKLRCRRGSSVPEVINLFLNEITGADTDPAKVWKVVSEQVLFQAMDNAQRTEYLVSFDFDHIAAKQGIEDPL